MTVICAQNHLTFCFPKRWWWSKAHRTGVSVSDPQQIQSATVRARSLSIVAGVFWKFFLDVLSQKEGKRILFHCKCCFVWFCRWLFFKSLICNIVWIGMRNPQLSSLQLRQPLKIGLANRRKAVGFRECNLELPLANLSCNGSYVEFEGMKLCSCSVVVCFVISQLHEIVRDTWCYQRWFGAIWWLWWHVVSSPSLFLNGNSTMTCTLPNLEAIRTCLGQWRLVPCKNPSKIAWNNTRDFALLFGYHFSQWWNVIPRTQWMVYLNLPTFTRKNSHSCR